MHETKVLTKHRTSERGVEREKEMQNVVHSSPCKPEGNNPTFATEPKRIIDSIIKTHTQKAQKNKIAKNNLINASYRPDVVAKCGTRKTGGMVNRM